MRVMCWQDMALRRRSRGHRSRRKRIVKLPAGYHVAMDLGNIIFPALYEFENGLRLLLNNYLQTCYGSDWWNASLRAKLHTVFDYAETQQKRLDSMPWIGSSSTVSVLPLHLVTLGQ